MLENLADARVSTKWNFDSILDTLLDRYKKLEQNKVRNESDEKLLKELKEKLLKEFNNFLSSKKPQLSISKVIESKEISQQNIEMKIDNKLHNPLYSPLIGISTGKTPVGLKDALFTEYSTIKDRFTFDQIKNKLEKFLGKVLKNEKLKDSDFIALYKGFFDENTKDEQPTKYEITLFTSALNVSLYHYITVQVVGALKKLVENPKKAEDIKKEHNNKINEKFKEIEEYTKILKNLHDQYIEKKGIVNFTDKSLQLYKNRTGEIIKIIRQYAIKPLDLASILPINLNTKLQQIFTDFSKQIAPENSLNSLIYDFEVQSKPAVFAFLQSDKKQYLNIIKNDFNSLETSKIGDISFKLRGEVDTTYMEKKSDKYFDFKVKNSLAGGFRGNGIDSSINSSDSLKKLQENRDYYTGRNQTSLFAELLNMYIIDSSLDETDKNNIKDILFKQLEELQKLYNSIKSEADIKKKEELKEEFIKYSLVTQFQIIHPSNSIQEETLKDEVGKGQSKVVLDLFEKYFLEQVSLPILKIVKNCVNQYYTNGISGVNIDSLEKSEAEEIKEAQIKREEFAKIMEKKIVFDELLRKLKKISETLKEIEEIRDDKSKSIFAKLEEISRVISQKKNELTSDETKKEANEFEEAKGKIEQVKTINQNLVKTPDADQNFKDLSDKITDVVLSSDNNNIEKTRLEELDKSYEDKNVNKALSIVRSTELQGFVDIRKTSNEQAPLFVKIKKPTAENPNKLIMHSNPLLPENTQIEIEFERGASYIPLIQKVLMRDLQGFLKGNYNKDYNVSFKIKTKDKEFNSIDELSGAKKADNTESLLSKPEEENLKKFKSAMESQARRNGFGVNVAQQA